MLLYPARELAMFIALCNTLDRLYNELDMNDGDYCGAMCIPDRIGYLQYLLVQLARRQTIYQGTINLA